MWIRPSRVLVIELEILRGVEVDSPELKPAFILYDPLSITMYCLVMVVGLSGRGEGFWVCLFFFSVGQTENYNRPREADEVRSDQIRFIRQIYEIG